MISMRHALLPGLLAALGLGHLGSGDLRADDTPVNTPASYRLYNPCTMGPGSSGCGRPEQRPYCNSGWFLNNPRGTGSDDPWRPPHCWPQTRYPVVPAYTRPSYGYYETSWRVLPLCNPTPATAGPIYPAGYASNNVPAAQPQPMQGSQPTQPLPQGTASQGQLPRPPVVPPAVQPGPQGPPTAVPPAATPPGATQPGGAGVPTAVPPIPLQPQKAVPPTNELQPQQPPKATPPATNPGLRGQNQGAVFGPERSALLDPQNFEAPEIRVQPF
jgi:hypothetical protein